MKKQGGFTLIELVVVIVILGILAVTAAPRFLNLQSDARESSLQGLKGAMAGAGSIVYGKAAIEGKETSGINVDVEGIDTIYGYPTATSAGIAAAVDGLNADWDVVSAAGVTNTNAISYTFKGQSQEGFTDASGCHVRYEQATSTAVGLTAKAVVLDDKC
ncbi:prepilin-type N-terminal cleavage/methylation domain-containing protein [Vibrio comitans]|uniref:MSHA pilin protein MshA n=1 Tax=Vibrio comitans NBRC 102076 TaxID=1219078 RepID=A0A4Y3ITD0_9VIBR|nr:prepilin-type N-terminal cleavage/methylation domain-containing protein [Vibrio comitans]GEA62335.1 MSHA pilin protein MshA [Vibrio comitans NBRC 102076]